MYSKSLRTLLFITIIASTVLISGCGNDNTDVATAYEVPAITVSVSDVGAITLNDDEHAVTQGETNMSTEVAVRPSAPCVDPVPLVGAWNCDLFDNFMYEFLEDGYGVFGFYPHLDTFRWSKDPNDEAVLLVERQAFDGSWSVFSDRYTIEGNTLTLYDALGSFRFTRNAS